LGPTQSPFLSFLCLIQTNPFYRGKVFATVFNIVLFLFGLQLITYQQDSTLMIKSLKSCNLSFGTNLTILVYTSSFLLLLLLLAAKSS
jgi:hypothetical protein